MSEWAAWAQCDAATEQWKRARSIVAQPEGGKACPPLEEASACSALLVADGEKPPTLFDGFLHVWDRALQGLGAFLFAQVGLF